MASRQKESNFPELNSKFKFEIRFRSSESTLRAVSSLSLSFLHQAGRYAELSCRKNSYFAERELTSYARAREMKLSRLRNPRAPACVMSRMSNASSNACIAPRWVSFEENVYLVARR